jgi:hypothetical protein
VQGYGERGHIAPSKCLPSCGSLLKM